MLKKVKSLSEAMFLARRDPKYAELVMTTAENLGYAPKTLEEAYDKLCMESMETDGGIVEEINSCREFVGK